MWEYLYHDLFSPTCCLKYGFLYTSQINNWNPMLVVFVSFFFSNLAFTFVLDNFHVIMVKMWNSKPIMYECSVIIKQIQTNKLRKALVLKRICIDQFILSMYISILYINLYQAVYFNISQL